MVPGLRAIAKAMGLPPAPTVRAPALDPTCERLGVRLPGATLPEVNRRPGYNGLPSLSLQRFISSLLGNDLSSTLRAVSTPAMGSPRGSSKPI